MISKERWVVLISYIFKNETTLLDFPNKVSKRRYLQECSSEPLPTLCNEVLNWREEHNDCSTNQSAGPKQIVEQNHSHDDLKETQVWVAERVHVGTPA